MYSGREKWFLVSMVAVAGLFSPLPANIYFPAIPTLTTVFDRSVEDLNLTVTVYLVMQGVSPMLWGPLSDRWGRRPLFLVCLAILTSASIGLALCPTSAYWLLLLLRIIQAGGCASTIALGAGVIGDIATNEERGGYFGMFNLGPMLAPCIGPAIGGALSQHLGWRSIFWFLAGFSGACFVLLLLFLPETLRALVGNGEIKPKMAIYRPVLPVIGEVEMETPDSEPKATQLQTVKGTMNPFQLLTYPDIVLTLTYTGIVYAVNYTITATISSSFAKVYPYLSETSLGLCYLTTGAGMILGSTFIGKFLDFDYARIKRLYLDEQDQSSMINSSSELENFPLEYARLRSMPLQIIIFSGCAIAWGWCLEKKISIAGPLVLQVACEYGVTRRTMKYWMRLFANPLSGMDFYLYSKRDNDVDD
jgi:multidrug resistance protein